MTHPSRRIFPSPGFFLGQFDRRIPNLIYFALNIQIPTDVPLSHCSIFLKLNNPYHLPYFVPSSAYWVKIFPPPYFTTVSVTLCQKEGTGVMKCACPLFLNVFETSGTGVVFSNEEGAF